jgi:ribosomal-protein-alanine N-acetyltransferase
LGRASPENVEGEREREKEMENHQAADVRVRRLFDITEAETCARMMSTSEPWITLRRGYEDSLNGLTDPLKESYVATSKEVIAGFMVLNMKGAFVGYVQTVCVAPEWRNQGIGTRLIDFAEKRIFTEVPNVFICVSSFNSRARALYKRLGYETIGELKDYIIPGQSEILMRKTTAPLTEFRRPRT